MSRMTLQVPFARMSGDHVAIVPNSTLNVTQATLYSFFIPPMEQDLEFQKPLSSRMSDDHTGMFINVIHGILVARM